METCVVSSERWQLFTAFNAFIGYIIGGYNYRYADDLSFSDNCGCESNEDERLGEGVREENRRHSENGSKANS